MCIGKKSHVCCYSYQNRHVNIKSADKTTIVAETLCEHNDPMKAVAIQFLPKCCMNDDVFSQGMTTLHRFVLFSALSIHSYGI